MKIGKRDFIFIAVAAVVFVFLFWGSGRDLGPIVPGDAIHQRFYRALAQEEDREKLEKGCPECHSRESLPEEHPPKQQCMFCHLPQG